MSVHDPILPLNLESNVEGGVRVLAKKLLTFPAAVCSRPIPTASTTRACGNF